MGAKMDELRREYSAWPGRDEMVEALLELDERLTAIEAAKPTENLDRVCTCTEHRSPLGVFRGLILDPQCQIHGTQR